MKRKLKVLCREEAMQSHNGEILSLSPSRSLSLRQKVSSLDETIKAQSVSESEAAAFL